MMTNDELSERIGDLWTDAGVAGLDVEFIEHAIQTLVIASLDLGVEGYSDYVDDDTDAIEALLCRKVHELLLVEIAKINGT